MSVSSIRGFSVIPKVALHIVYQCTKFEVASLGEVGNKTTFRWHIYLVRLISVPKITLVGQLLLKLPLEVRGFVVYFSATQCRISGLLCGTVSVNLRLAVLVKVRLVTDTDRQTDTRRQHIPSDQSPRRPAKII